MRAVPLWHVHPPASRRENADDPVDSLPVIVPWSTGAIRRREMRPYELPLFIRELTEFHTDRRDGRMMIERRVRSVRPIASMSFQMSSICFGVRTQHLRVIPLKDLLSFSHDFAWSAAFEIPRNLVSSLMRIVHPAYRDEGGAPEHA